MALYQFLKEFTHERYPTVSRAFLRVSKTNNDNNNIGDTATSNTTPAMYMSPSAPQRPKEWVIHQYNHDMSGNVIPQPIRTYHVTAPDDVSVLSVLQGSGAFRQEQQQQPDRAAWGDLFKSLFITVLTGVLIAVIANLFINWFKHWRDRDRIEYEEAVTQYLRRQIEHEMVTNPVAKQPPTVSK